jgi:hypothetical protein
MSDNLDTNLPKVVGRPWAVGNSGRPAGSKNKSTVRKETFKSADVKAARKLVMDGVAAGESWAIEYLVPKAKEPKVTFPWRPIESKADVALAYEGLMQSVANGTLTIGQGRDLSALIDKYAKHIWRPAISRNAWRVSKA